MRHSCHFMALRLGLTLSLVGLSFLVPGAGREPVTKAMSIVSPDPHSPGHNLVYPLTISPTMTWNTFMGGSSFDFGKGIALDVNGKVYAVGYSSTSWGAPKRAYAEGQDAFVAQVDSGGVRQWNTFLGSAGTDNGNGIAVDGSGNVYIVGTSDATWGGPLESFQGGGDAFVAKLNSSGDLQWHTFLGGSSADVGNAIAVDGNSNVYVVGISVSTWGSPIDPYPAGKWQAPFAAKLDSSGTLEWNTFWGGGSLDVGSSVAADGSGNVYVAGECYATWGSPVNGFAGGSEACVAKLDTSGHRQWNTFLGSADSDSAHGIVVESGNVYVVGISSATWGTPVSPFSGGSGYDAFAARLSASDGIRQWNTFMGGPDPDQGNGITTDSAGNVYVVGDTKDTWSAVSNAPAGVLTDAFLVKLKSDGSRDWTVYMGATYNNDTGAGIAVDGGGHLYVVGGSNDTWNSPIAPYTGSLDTFVAKWEVPAQVDMVINKSASPSIADPGKTVTYTLAFSNGGYLTATGVLITDVVPISLTDIGYVGTGVSVTPTGSISYTWKVQDLAPGVSGILTITGIISPGLKPGMVLINTATITGTTTDGNPDDNSSSVSVLVPSSRVFVPLVLKN